MKKLMAMLLAVGVVVGMAFVSDAKAATKKTTPQAKPKVTLVKAVDLNGKTITIQTADREPEVYSFNDMVQVFVDGKSAKIADVQTGMKVSLIGSLKLVNRIDAQTYVAPVTPAKKR